MEIIFVGFCIFILTTVVIKFNSYLKAAEMLVMVKISSELDTQYYAEVVRAVNYSTNKNKAVAQLKERVSGTTMATGGRDYEYDVICEMNRRGKNGLLA